MEQRFDKNIGYNKCVTDKTVAHYFLYRIT